MATAHPLAPLAAEQGNAPASGVVPEIAVEQALVPSPQSPGEEERIELSAAVAGLPVELDVAIPVRDFRVRNLLALEPNHLIESGWGHGEDVPLAAGDVQLAWSEFEVIDTLLAVRVTRLA